MAKLNPPPLPPVPSGDEEFARPPEYARGDSQATTGPRDLAEFLGPPSRVVTPRGKTPPPTPSE